MPPAAPQDFRLLLLLLAPLAAIIFILLKAPPRRAAGFACAFNLLYSIGLILFYPAKQGGYQYVLNCLWVDMPGLPPIHFHLGIDGISLPLVFLTSIVSFAAVAIQRSSASGPNGRRAPLPDPSGSACWGAAIWKPLCGRS